MVLQVSPSGMWGLGSRSGVGRVAGNEGKPSDLSDVVTIVSIKVDPGRSLSLCEV
jgi:hypothetical protein